MNFIGVLYLIITFAICFFTVAFCKLAVLGFKSLRKKPVPRPAPKPVEKKVEPVYYIVEKKRAKRNYSQPREIQFKENKS